MPKRELPKENGLGGFNMKNYLKQNQAEKESEEKSPVEENDQEKESQEKKPQQESPGKVTKQQGTKVGKSGGRTSASKVQVSPNVKIKENGSSQEEKIAFMNYLPTDLHEEFGDLFYGVKKAFRQKRKVAVSQTEFVEAILRHTVDNWKEVEDEIIEMVERTLDNRRSKDQ